VTVDAEADQVAAAEREAVVDGFLLRDVPDV
jgi:hypothetical protein